MASLSGENLAISDIDEHYWIVSEAIACFYDPISPTFSSRFIGYTPLELVSERDERQREHEIQCILSLLAAVEALFRIDFINRVSRKKRDSLSKHFRELFRRYEYRLSFEDEILEGWKIYSNVSPSFVGDIKTAFKFRHWIAHGRYWVPKFGKRIDYVDLYRDIISVLPGLPFIV